MTTNSKEGVSMNTKTGKHTEGPWNYEKDDVDETFFITNNSIQPFGEDIAYKIKKESNAHLIASAPELLEACKLAKNAIFEANYTQLGEEAINSINKAISKSEGR